MVSAQSQVCPLRTVRKCLVIKGSSRIKDKPGEHRMGGSHRCFRWVGLCNQAVLGTAGQSGGSTPSRTPHVSQVVIRETTWVSGREFLEWRRGQDWGKTHCSLSPHCLVLQIHSFKLCFTPLSSSFQHHLGQINQHLCFSFSYLLAARRCQTPKELKIQALSFPQKGAYFGPVMGYYIIQCFHRATLGKCLAVRCRKKQGQGVWISKTGSHIFVK